MQVDQCPKNVRCDSASCHQFALVNINTNSYKRNICLCESCFEDLYKAIKQFKKESKQKN